VLVLYIYDLQMVKEAEARADNEAEKTLFAVTLKEHQFEMWVIVPLGILFNGFIAWLLFYRPDIFIDNKHHVWFVCLQAIVNIVLLRISVKSFNARKELINQID
jgi:hypothetical protein